MPAISIKDLRKSYANHDAVNGVTLDIIEGEILGLLGPNGAGKTTTIGCICGLVDITSGSIEVMGFDVEKDPVEAKRRLGLSEQEPKADQYFSIEQILRYQAGYHGLRNVEDKIRENLRDFGLEDKRKDTFRQLSGGMKRKVSIIKALMHDPDVLILDEPTAGLDIESRYELWGFIRDLKKRGKTIILTTHYIEEAEQLADRIAIINHGKLLSVQPTEEMLEELSQNRVVLFFEKEPKIPVSLEDLDIRVEERKLVITCSKKDQNEVLQRALRALPDVRNFQIEQDKLENIFRRIVNA